MDRRSFEHLCELARLELEEGEVAEFERKFKRLLGFVEQVQQYVPIAEDPLLVFGDKVELRRDRAVPYDWPEGTRHDYRAPRIIDFEGGG